MAYTSNIYIYYIHILKVLSLFAIVIAALFGSLSGAQAQSTPNDFGLAASPAVLNVKQAVLLETPHTDDRVLIVGLSAGATWVRAVLTYTPTTKFISGYQGELKDVIMWPAPSVISFNAKVLGYEEGKLKLEATQVKLEAHKMWKVITNKATVMVAPSAQHNQMGQDSLLLLVNDRNGLNPTIIYTKRGDAPILGTDVDSWASGDEMILKQLFRYDAVAKVYKPYRSLSLLRARSPQKRAHNFISTAELNPSVLPDLVSVQTSAKVNDKIIYNNNLNKDVYLSFDNSYITNALRTPVLVKSRQKQEIPIKKLKNVDVKVNVDYERPAESQTTHDQSFTFHVN